MNPPETSQSKKFRQRRKKKEFISVNDLSMTLLFYTYFLLSFVLCWKLPQKRSFKGTKWTDHKGHWTRFSNDFKIVFQGQCLIGLDCNLEPQKRLELSPPPKMHSGEATLLNRAQILTRGIFGCYCQSLFVSMMLIGTVFENHRKSLIQHCERSELLLHLEWTKVD